MTPQRRHYGDESDYWRARGLFRDLYRYDDRPGSHWQVAQFDYWRWHWLENVVERPPEELCLWEADGGEIVAVLLQGDPGVCHLHVHPRHRTPALEYEMVATAEREYAAPMDDGRRIVWVWAMKGDTPLQRVLTQRGFRRWPGGEHSVEHHGRRRLIEPVHRVPVPEGFAVRSMGDEEDLPRRSLASWRAFHPDESEDGCDRTGGWYRNVQRAPLYRRDLDVVAVAPNGDIASFATCYFDDVTRAGVFVLDGTAEQYRRRGLATAAMTEALRRLQHIGATAAYVSWYDDPAGALYEAVGFLDQQLGQVWAKHLYRDGVTHPCHVAQNRLTFDGDDPCWDES